MANNYGAFAAAVPPVLNLVDFAHRLVGPTPLDLFGPLYRRVELVPTWNPYMPRVRPRAARVCCVQLLLAALLFWRKAGG